MNPFLGVVELQPIAGPAEGIGENDVGAGIDEALVEGANPFGVRLIP
jgi:hypothetical protein